MNQEPLWVDQKDFAEKISMKLNGVWNKKKKGWNVECPYCPTHEQPRQNKRLRKQAIIREGNSSRKTRWMLMCPICQCDGRSTAGVPLSKLMKEHHPRLHQEWEDSWEAIANQKRTIEKPLPIMNRRTEERTEYKKRSFKEKQAVKSMALEFMQKSSGR